MSDMKCEAPRREEGDNHPSERGQDQDQELGLALRMSQETEAVRMYRLRREEAEILAQVLTLSLQKSTVQELSEGNM